jgi:hypothetical protein
MFVPGGAFRLFGVGQFKHTGSIPQWNPCLFGGMPYIAAMHGDFSYPTALAMTCGGSMHERRRRGET